MNTIDHCVASVLPEQVYFDVFKSAQASMVITDSGGVICRVNPAFTRMTGYAPDEVIGQTPAILKGDSNSPGFYRFMWMTLNSGEPWRGRFHNRRKDGSLYWVEQTITPLTDPAGGVSHFVAIGIEISDAQEAYELEAKTLRALKSAVHALDESFAIFDENAELLLCNDSYRSLGLATKPEAPPVDELGLPTALVNMLQRSGMSIARVGERWVRLIERKTADGYSVVFHIDITDLIRLHLDAAQAGRAKNEFLANMSHEIRTPLNAIVGLTDLAKNDPTKISKDYLEKIESAASTLLALVSDVLDFSKSQAGQFQLEHEVFHLALLLNEVMDLIRPKSDAKGLFLHMEREPDTPSYVIGDPLRVKQVLLNLLSNAVKFTEQGSVFLTVRCIESLPESSLMRLSVVDTGIGMEPSAIEALFEPFVQGDASTTRKYGGTGLGLAITKQLVELMGGKVEASSELGKWSVFNVDIPFSIPNAQAIDRDAISREKRKGCQPAGVPAYARFLTGKHVLLVEDNPVNQSVGKGLLEILGANVAIADNGQAALNCVLERTPDLILMDLQMPIMGGIEATRCIRDELGFKNIPIYALTAHTLSEERANCMAAGMSGFISKPVTLNSLSLALDELRCRFTQPRDDQSSAIGGHGVDVIAGLPQVDGIDVSMGIIYSGDDPAIYREALNIFLDKLPILDDKIKIALLNQNMQEVRRYAHSLKGMSGAVGATKLQKVAALIERSVTEEELESLNVLSVTLEQEIEVVLRAAECLLAQLNP